MLLDSLETYKCLWCQEILPNTKKTRFCKSRHREMHNSFIYLFRAKEKAMKQKLHLMLDEDFVLLTPPTVNPQKPTEIKPQ